MYSKHRKQVLLITISSEVVQILSHISCSITNANKMRFNGVSLFNDLRMVALATFFHCPLNAKPKDCFTYILC